MHSMYIHIYIYIYIHIYICTHFYACSFALETYVDWSKRHLAAGDARLDARSQNKRPYMCYTFIHSMHIHAYHAPATLPTLYNIYLLHNMYVYHTMYVEIHINKHMFTHIPANTYVYTYTSGGGRHLAASDSRLDARSQHPRAYMYFSSCIIYVS